MEEKLNLAFTASKLYCRGYILRPEQPKATDHAKLLG